MSTQALKNELREKFIEQFLYDAFGDYTWMEWVLSLNDEGEDETAFEVTLKNNTNSVTTMQILQSDDEGNISMLRGDDFDVVDMEDFLRWLFFDLFLTYTEE